MHRPVHSKPTMGRLILSDITRRAALASGAALAFAGPALANAQVSVFAAASLKPALDEIAAGWDVTLSYAGSGTLARQVAAGAPADVVLLAATDWMNWLAGQNVLVGDPVPVAGNRLVLVGPAGVGRVMLSGRGISAALGPGRLAMGDPMSVPAGRYAQQALETLGLWTGLSDRLLLTTDVRAALAYVARGDVPLGVVYKSDAVGTGVEVAATFPADSHAPILYLAACVTARPEAAEFLSHLRASGDILAAYGFTAAPTE